MLSENFTYLRVRIIFIKSIQAMNDEPHGFWNFIANMFRCDKRLPSILQKKIRCILIELIWWDSYNLEWLWVYKCRLKIYKWCISIGFTRNFFLKFVSVVFENVSQLIGNNEHESIFNGNRACFKHQVLRNERLQRAA